VSYLIEGDPPSGPSSFSVLGDGSLVIADTMALYRGEPRLLRYDRTGNALSPIELVDADVASIVDVVSSGQSLAILDVLVARGRYRVLTITLDGEISSMVDLPSGYHLEDGLTGLVWDDEGILLEFELGARYARIEDGVVAEMGELPVFEGKELAIATSESRETTVSYGEETWVVERGTEFGGVSLVGVAPSGAVVVVVDEVDTSGPMISVMRRIQRYAAAGEMLSEVQIDAGRQYVEIARPLELAADGELVYMESRPDTLEIVPESSLGN